MTTAPGRSGCRTPAPTRAVTSWTAGTTAGRDLPLSSFHIARPDQSAAQLANALARGKNLLLTPGVYDVDRSLVVRRDDTVVLGMGQATLTAVGGAVPLVVRHQAEGVVLAGVTVDAGTGLSPTLVHIGQGGGASADHRPTPARTTPTTTLNDVYLRVGGPHIGRADVSLRIDADDVLIDHAWVWRADHGIEGFTAGASGDTDRWNTNIGRVGLVVNGDRVQRHGPLRRALPGAQHHLERRGRPRRALPERAPLRPALAGRLDPTGRHPRLGGLQGRSDDVQRHQLFGGGVYVFNRNDPSITTARGFEVPDRAGVRLHHVLTVNLDAGSIEHVVNDTGARVDSTAPGVPSYVVDYPAP